MKILKESLFESTKKQYFSIEEVCSAWQSFCEAYVLWKFRDYEGPIEEFAKLVDIQWLSDFAYSLDDDIQVDVGQTPNSKRSARMRLIREILQYAEYVDESEFYIKLTTELIRNTKSLSKVYDLVFYNYWEEPLEYECYLKDEEYEY